ncbi:MAG TPA: XdhC family protein [Candidatus Angelobacter sp.]|nr:XdhC family protein [Candidatus Angelobacter sp.]
MGTQALHDRAQSLRDHRVPFVHARVVLAERPTSAKPGDEALVTADGSIDGFVGGQCAESTVRSQALSLLASGDSMLLRIAPNPEADQPGKTVVHNPCLSGGTLEIFLEPVLPVPLVSVLGESPIARAMSMVAASLGYDVAPYSVDDLSSADAVLVATHGKHEEETLTAAVRAGVPYVGLIASPKRGAAVVGSLELSDEERARIHYPAGLDIGARTPAEIALSVFAQVIAERPRVPRAPRDPQHLPGEPPMTRLGVLTIEPDTAIDPVCGMTVTIDAEALYADVGGERVYFCCPACRRAYVADPGKYPRS